MVKVAMLRVVMAIVAVMVVICDGGVCMCEKNIMHTHVCQRVIIMHMTLKHMYDSFSIYMKHMQKRLI